MALRNCSVHSKRRRNARGNVDKCLNCQFYDRRNARPTDGRAAMWGQCRRHSPHLNPLSAKAHLSKAVWPLIRDDDWCGEWKAPPCFDLANAIHAAYQ